MTFGSPTRLRSVGPSEARVHTPLGTMGFSADVSGQTMAVSDTLVGDSGLQLRRYEHPRADVELLILPFSPKIPAHMRVDGCVAAVWRMVATQNDAEVTFRATWLLGSRTQDGGGNSGEHLTALTWYASGVQASLGTSDEEMLSYAAKDGYLPARLAPALRAEELWCARLVGDGDGLEIVLPPLLKGEAAQVHMVLAWVTGELSDDECSPWFAVDLAPREIARIVDEALRGSA